METIGGDQADMDPYRARAQQQTQSRKARPNIYGSGDQPLTDEPRPRKRTGGISDKPDDAKTTYAPANPSNPYYGSGVNLFK